MILRDVVEKHIIKNQYEGLVNLEINCGCELQDLMSCEGPLDNCQPGYITKKGRYSKGYRPGRKPKGGVYGLKYEA